MVRQAIARPLTAGHPLRITIADAGEAFEKPMIPIGTDEQRLRTLFACGERLVSEELKTVEAELELLTTQHELAVLEAEQQQHDQEVAELCRQVLSSIIDGICAGTDDEKQVHK